MLDNALITNKCHRGSISIKVINTFFQWHVIKFHVLFNNFTHCTKPSYSLSRKHECTLSAWTPSQYCITCVKFSLHGCCNSFGPCIISHRSSWWCCSMSRSTNSTIALEAAVTWCSNCKMRECSHTSWTRRTLMNHKWWFLIPHPELTNTPWRITSPPTDKYQSCLMTTNESELMPSHVVSTESELMNTSWRITRKCGES